jgi:hypothetical protein
MRALITVIRGTKGLNVRPRCIGTAWSLPFGAILQRVKIADAVLIQFDLLRMSVILLETCRGLQYKYYIIKELCIKLVIETSLQKF